MTQVCHCVTFRWPLIKLYQTTKSYDIAICEYVDCRIRAFVSGSASQCSGLWAGESGGRPHGGFPRRHMGLRGSLKVQVDGACPALVVTFLPARRYASADTIATALCPSVSVTSRCSIETDERIELGFFWHESYLRPVLQCVVRKFSYLRK